MSSQFTLPSVKLMIADIDFDVTSVGTHFALGYVSDLYVQ